jgi:hypothetical protein
VRLSGVVQPDLISAILFAAFDGGGEEITQDAFIVSRVPSIGGRWV